jgi:hypothetical protein
MRIIDATGYRWFSYLVASVLLLVAATFLTIALLDLAPAEDPQARGWQIAFLLLFAAFAGHGLYDVLSYPTRIVVHADGRFVLHSPIHVVPLSAPDVIELACDGDGDWYLRHGSKKAHLQFFRKAQMESFQRDLLAHNPRIARP